MIQPHNTQQTLNALVQRYGKKKEAYLKGPYIWNHLIRAPKTMPHCSNRH